MWEEIYSDIQSILVILINIHKASSKIISKADDSVLFDLLKELLRISILVPAASKWTWLHKAIIHGSNLIRSPHMDWVKLDLVDI